MRRTALLFLLPLFGALPLRSQSIPAYAIPNSKHYRESGVGNANGRSGNAHMTVRALLGADGDTTVEVTTGTLDSNATPPGSFSKVQVKPLNQDGDALFAQNFTPLSTPTGYYKFNWPSLARHQQAQIQANITGIDNRTDVVTLVETVKLRPDVAVQKIFLPDSPLVNTPVIITANLAELNGDAAATTTCQLFIDGTLADKSSKVYIDAGSAITCAFMHAFANTGNHTIQVTAANVAPADWDTENNSASGTINVISLNTSLAEHGKANFNDQKGGFPLSQTFSMQQWKAGTLITSIGGSSSSTGEQQDSDSSFFSGGCIGQTKAAAYQFPVDITYGESMDGTAAYSVKVTGIAANSTTYAINQFQCGTTLVSQAQQVGTTFADDYMFQVISDVYYDSASTPVLVDQKVSSIRNAGDVTYLSSNYQCMVIGDCDNPPTNYYVNNNNTTSTVGTVVTPGNTWVPSITVTDAGGNGFGGSLAVSLTSSQVTQGHPNKCTTTGPNGLGITTQTCTSSSTDYTLITGSASY